MALAIDIGEGVNTVKPYARQYTFPVLLDQSASVFYAYTHNNATPLNYVIDPNGIVRYWGEGFDETSVRNTITSWFPVDHDVGTFRIVSPITSIDSGTTVTPACSVYNYGANTESYQVQMKIGADYDQTASVAGHAAGTALYLTFPSWTASARGPTTVSCSTELSGDMRTDNDKATSTTQVAVYDVACTAILAPVDSVDSGSSVIPTVILTDPGSMYVRAKLKLSIEGVYFDSVTKSILPGQVDTVAFPTWIPSLLGTFAVRCTVTAVRDLNPENNLATGTVSVVYHTAVAEPGPASLKSDAALCADPNPMTRQTFIHYARRDPQSPVSALAIYSATGRLIRTLAVSPTGTAPQTVLWNGCDDHGNRVERGIYYCRLISGTGNEVLKLIKVE